MPDGDRVTHVLVHRTYPPPVAQSFAAAAGVAATQLDGDHCAMLTDPDLLVETLLAAT